MYPLWKLIVISICSFFLGAILTGLFVVAWHFRREQKLDKKKSALNNKERDKEMEQLKRDIEESQKRLDECSKEMSRLLSEEGDGCGNEDIYDCNQDTYYS